MEIMELIADLPGKLKHDVEMTIATGAGLMDVAYRFGKEEAEAVAAGDLTKAGQIADEYAAIGKELVEKVAVPASKDHDMDPTSTLRHCMRIFLNRHSQNEEANRVAGVSDGTPNEY